MENSKNKKEKIIALAIVGVVAVSGAIGYGVFASADEGDFFAHKGELKQEMNRLIGEGNLDELKALKEEMGKTGPHAEKKAEMKQIMEDGDSEAWATTMNEKKNKMLEKLADFESSINEDTFAKHQEAHTLMEAGDFEGAKAIKSDLGFPEKGHKGFGHRIK